MPENTTKYWASEFKKWWDTTGSLQAKPRYPKHLKEGYLDAQTLEIKNGIERTPLDFNNGRIAKLERRGGDQGLKVVYSDTLSNKGDNRRATTKGKTISLQEREDWYKRNLYDDPKGRASADHKADQAARKGLRQEIKVQNQNITDPERKLIYEHLSPLNADEKTRGGFESARNTVPAEAKPNGLKSDRIASAETYREQRVPMSRQENIRADARRVPLPDAATRFQEVFKDIITNNRPSARSTSNTRRSALSARTMRPTSRAPRAEAGFVSMPEVKLPNKKQLLSIASHFVPGPSKQAITALSSGPVQEDTRSTGLKVVDTLTSGLEPIKSMVRQANPQLDEEKDLQQTTNEIQKFLKNPLNELKWGLKILQSGM
jgi:hypothetical protein